MKWCTDINSICTYRGQNYSQNVIWFGNFSCFFQFPGTFLRAITFVLIDQFQKFQKRWTKHKTRKIRPLDLNLPPNTRTELEREILIYGGFFYHTSYRSLSHNFFVYGPISKLLPVLESADNSQQIISWGPSSPTYSERYNWLGGKFDLETQIWRSRVKVTLFILIPSDAQSPKIWYLTLTLPFYLILGQRYLTFTFGTTALPNFFGP